MNQDKNTYKNKNDKNESGHTDYGKYEAVIGLETHVELSTATKMFCGCKLSFGSEPNMYTCPVCLGHPGTLPVLNRKAIDYAIKVALALNCTINNYSIFHRKNYFYPDMAKNYQISQYNLPISSRGYLDVNMGDYVRRVGITRVHLEEDTGKLIHTGISGRISESAASIVDFNRSGTPLIEIVTEPDIKSPAEAKEYLISLRNLLIYLDVSDCSMEEGSLRCDANVSIRLTGAAELGTKAELKNLNSFKFLQKGLDYEVKRQIKLLESGKKVIQQTRHYDHITDSTKALRSKEEAHDYRYLPDPDLVPMYIEKESVKKIKAEIPELPFEKAVRFTSKYGISDYDCRFLVADRWLAEYFEECCALYGNPKNVVNWLMGDFIALLNKEGIPINQSKITPEKLIHMLVMIDSGKISLKIAKSVFEEMFATGNDPQKIIESKGLEQISDEGMIEGVVEKVLGENPATVEQFRSGKEKALGFLVGKVMAQTGGKANPRLVNEILRKKLQ